MLMWKLIKGNLTWPNRKRWTLHLLIGYQLHPSDSVSEILLSPWTLTFFQWTFLQNYPSNFLLLFFFFNWIPLLYLLDLPMTLAMACLSWTASLWYSQGISLVAQMVKNPPAMQETQVQLPDGGHSGPRDSAWEAVRGFIVCHAFTCSAYNLSAHYMAGNLQGEKKFSLQYCASSSLSGHPTTLEHKASHTSREIWEEGNEY